MKTTYIIFLLIIHSLFVINDKNPTVMCSDGLGYYAWLPAVFIYQDLNFGFFYKEERKAMPDGCYQNYLYSFNSKECNKYYVGTALYNIPAFLVAHCYTLLNSQTYLANGYSMPYHNGVAFTGFLIGFLGLFYLSKLFKLIGCSESVSSILILFVYWGTTFQWYTQSVPYYSHIYSFTTIIVVAYHFFKFSFDKNIGNLLWIGLLTGLIAVLRPINITVLLLFPFVFFQYNNWNTFISIFKKHFTSICLTIILACIFPFIQSLLYKISTGSFIIYSYSNETFNFASPNLYNFIFSTFNGIFPYTPILIIGLLGFIYLFRTQYVLGLGLALVIGLSIYISASWWCWWYGLCGIGNRVSLDIVGLYALVWVYLLIIPTTYKMKRFYAIVLTCSCLFTYYMYSCFYAGLMTTCPITQEGYFSLFNPFINKRDNSQNFLEPKNYIHPAFKMQYNLKNILLENDTASLSKKVISSNGILSNEKHLIYGPYISLKSTENCIKFVMKVEDNKSNDPICEIDIVGAGKVESSLVLKSSDFYKSNVYQTFKLPISPLNESQSWEWRVWYIKGTKLTIDYTEVCQDTNLKNESESKLQEFIRVWNPFNNKRDREYQSEYLKPTEYIKLAYKMPYIKERILTENDSTSLSGKVVSSTKVKDHLIFGPWVNLRSSENCIKFVMKVDNNSSAEPVCEIDVLGNGKNVNSRIIKANDFKKSNVYQEFYLNIDPKNESQTWEWRVRYIGGAKLSIDYTEVTRANIFK